MIPHGLEYSQMCQTRSAVVLPVSDTIGLLLCSASNAAANFGGGATFQPSPGAATNAEALSKVLYTDYLLLFQMSGIVLLVAMMGAIVLTLRSRPSVKRQNIAEQTGRKRKDAVELKDVRPGQGL